MLNSWSFHSSIKVEDQASACESIQFKYNSCGTLKEECSAYV